MSVDALWWDTEEPDLSRSHPPPLIVGSRYTITGCILSVHSANPVRGPFVSFGGQEPGPQQPRWVRELHDGRVVYL